MLFRVLGPVETVASGPGARKPGTVLAVLLLNPNRWTTVGRLIEATWQEQDAPPSAEKNLKTYIWQLRRALPADRIESRPGAYRIRVEPGELDADAAVEAGVRGRQELGDGHAAAAAATFTEALELWRGRPFDGLGGAVAEPEVARLDDLHRDLRTGLADAWLALGRTAEAIALLRDLVTEAPLREDTQARLVRALHQAGRRDEAVAVYARARTTLSAELGIEPGPELAEALHAALSSAATRPRNDLPRDLPEFTGREAELEQAERRRSLGVLVLDGPAGSGKTALAVHLAHRLSGDYPDAQLFVDLRTHGDNPLSTSDALARLLRAAGVAELPDDVDERAARWRAELAGKRVLLVLDDAASAAQVRPLLPGGAGCLVLVTTRAGMADLEGSATLGLRSLDAEAGARLFAAAVGDWRADAESTVVNEVVRRCDGLPSAIRAAGVRLRERPTWTVSRLLENRAGRQLPENFEARAKVRSVVA